MATKQRVNVRLPDKSLVDIVVSPGATWAQVRAAVHPHLRAWSLGEHDFALASDSRGHTPRYELFPDTAHVFPGEDRAFVVPAPGGPGTGGKRTFRYLLHDRFKGHSCDELEKEHVTIDELHQLARQLEYKGQELDAKNFGEACGRLRYWLAIHEADRASEALRRKMEQLMSAEVPPPTPRTFPYEVFVKTPEGGSTRVEIHRGTTWRKIRHAAAERFGLLPEEMVMIHRGESMPNDAEIGILPDSTALHIQRVGR